MDNKKNSPLKRIWVLAKSEHPRLRTSVVLAILGVISGFLPYYAIANIVIILLGKEATMGACVPYLAIALTGAIGKVILSTMSTAVSHRATFSVLAQIRTKCIQKMSRLSMGTLQEQSVGKLKSTLVDQIETMETTLAHLVPEMTSNILAPIVLIIALLCIDWRLALISIATLPIGMLIMMTTMKDYPKKYEKSVQIGKHMNESIVEYINGIEVIKSFNQGKDAYVGYENAVNENANYYYQWMKSCQIATSCYRNICPAVLIGTLPAGLMFYSHGSISSADFILVMIMALGVVGPIIKATEFIDNLAQTGTIIESIETILDAKEQSHPSKEVALQGNDIKLSHVTFSYESSQEAVLKDVSLCIKEGTVTALVGPSGGGKSTITKLIAAFWDVEKGHITLGGKDLKQIPLSQIADCIAYVAQDNFLFDDTIRENIRMGNENASDLEVEEVAKKAGCDEFIRGLEDGYDTKVGGGGTHLSGGERQRIAIARAMLKNAPIVILDEATAYMDPENEAMVQKAIAKLVKGKTLIMIAHRLSTVIGADQIALIEDGCVRSSGTHQELLEKSMLYKNMWEAHIGVKEVKGA